VLALLKEDFTGKLRKDYRMQAVVRSNQNSLWPLAIGL